MKPVEREDIYQALVDDEAFANLPNLLAQACGGRSGTIQWHHNEGPVDLLAYSHFTDDFICQYGQQFADKDPWVQIAIRHDIRNRIDNTHHYMSEIAFGKSTLWNELMRPMGDDTFYCIGGAYSSPFGFGVLGIHRGRSQGPFEDENVAALKPLARDLSRILRVKGELASQKLRLDASSAAWNATSLACVIVRRDGRVAQVNRAAEAVLRREDVLQLRSSTVAAVLPTQQAEFEAAIRSATTPRGAVGSTLALRSIKGQHQYLLSVAPLSKPSGPQLALILFRDPLSRTGTIGDQLRQVWGLTVQEAAVAEDIARGLSIRPLADKRGVTENTIKSQLKAISAKLECRGQLEMMARIRDLPPLV